MKTEQFRINENSDFSGVYIIVNMDNQKVYIGSTRNIHKRLKEHLYNLKKRKHLSSTLQEDFNNGNSFIAYPLTRVELLPKYSKDHNLRHFEYMAIKIFDSANPEKGYNKTNHKAESYELGKIKRANSQFNDFFEVKEKYKAKAKFYCKEYYEEELEFFLKQAMR